MSSQEWRRKEKEEKELGRLESEMGQQKRSRERPGRREEYRAMTGKQKSVE